MAHDKLQVRLAQILTKLNNGERFTLRDLAMEFNVSVSFSFKSNSKNNTNKMTFKIKDKKILERNI